MADTLGFIPDPQPTPAPDTSLGFIPDPPPPPNMAPTKQIFDEHLKNQDPNSSFMDTVKSMFSDSQKAYETGYSGSVEGMLRSGKAPTEFLPEDAPMYMRIASQVGGLRGDIVAMVAGATAGSEVGAMAGGAAGSVVPGVGTVAGAGAGAALGSGYGAFALPAAIRKTLMDHYEKGDVKDFNDFWERAAATFIDANKQGIVGAATTAAGGITGKLAEPFVKPLVKTASQLAAEVTTMTTVGKAIEGEVPHPQDFIDAAVLVGGLHGATSVAGKLRNIYAKTGVRPELVIEQAKTDPTIVQDLLSVNKSYPDTIAKTTGVPDSVPVKGELGAKPEPPKPEMNLSEAEQKIQSMIGEKAAKSKEPLSLAKLYEDRVDKLDPIKTAIEKLNVDPNSLKADENPYILSRMENDYKAKAMHFIEKGTLDFNSLAINGEPLKASLDMVAKNADAYQRYEISKRVIEKEGQGIKTGFDLEAAKKVVSEGDAKFGDAYKGVVDFRNNVLKYVKDSGRISETDYNNMLAKNEDYAPFKRLIEEGQAGSPDGKNSNSSLKKMTGSDAKIQGTLISTLENTQALIRLAEKNRAISSMVELAESQKGQEIFSKVESPKAKLKANEFEFYRNGEREVWQTDDNIARAIKSLDADIPASNLAVKMFKGITRIKRLGISLTPDFILKNIFRDQLTAGVFSKSAWHVPFVDTVYAMGDLIRKNDTYYNWLKSGGAGGTFLEIDNNYLQKEILKLEKETNMIEASWNVVTKPIQWIEAAGSLAEQATRLAEFKRVTKGASSGSKIFEGGFASREVTVDFQRIGAKMSALNAITAFQNVSIQGLDRTVRALKEDPVGVSAKAIASITVPSVLLWYANHDDERYKQAPQWQKDLFWIIPTDKWEKPEQGEEQTFPDHLKRINEKGQLEVNKGVTFRIPKPQELGIMFGTTAERLLESFFTDNPAAYKDFGKTIAGMLAPSMVPDAIAPIAEKWANKSLFTEGPIVPSAMEGILPQYQYTEYTTETAKALGKIIRVIPGTSDGKLPWSSPMVLENTIRSWTGTTGMYALQIADAGLKKAGVAETKVKAEDTLADMPFVKSFISRYPSAGAKSIQDFYDNYQPREQLQKTLTHLKQTGNYVEYLNVIKDPQNEDNLMRLSGIKTSLSNMGNLARKINDNPDISPKEKRQLIDSTYWQMIELSKLGNQLTLQVDKSLGK